LVLSLEGECGHLGYVGLGYLELDGGAVSSDEDGALDLGYPGFEGGEWFLRSGA
jgi:hypothetical protein